MALAGQPGNRRAGPQPLRQDPPNTPTRNTAHALTQYRAARAIHKLPPLESLRAFEAAARHESFIRTGEEIGVTSVTIAKRVATLERYLDAKLFTRQTQGIRLNAHGRAYADDVRRILNELAEATELRRMHSGTIRLKLVSVEAVAEKWLMPRLNGFREAHPEITIEFETDHREVDPRRRDFDVWIAFTERIDQELQSETLFEETLLPVCSPRLLASRTAPSTPADLHEWPLLYDLHWTTYWSHWFNQQGHAAPDLAKACGFRLYSMMIQAAVNGMGVALGHSLMIRDELEEGTLVSLFEPVVTAPARYVLVRGPDAETKPQVRAFRTWVLRETGKRNSEPDRVTDIRTRRPPTR